MRRTATTLALSLTLVLAASAAAVAQEHVTLSAAQQQLNDEGVEALIAGDASGAIAAFRSSLALGESNVTWLNLGRALHRAGACEEALDAYQRAETAARVAQPTPDEVAQILVRYRSELDPAQCAARLVLECRPSTLQVSIDGEEPVSCPAQPLELAPGTHQIVALYKDQRMTETVTLGGMERRTLALTFDVLGPAPQTLDAGAVEPVAAADGGVSGLAVAGWVGVGLGGAALVTALALELTLLQDYVDQSEKGELDLAELEDAEALQGANLALYVGGGLLVAAGVTLVLVDAFSGSDDGSPSAQRQLVPLVTSDGAGLGWWMRF